MVLCHPQKSEMSPGGTCLPFENRCSTPLPKTLRRTISLPTSQKHSLLQLYLAVRIRCPQMKYLTPIGQTGSLLLAAYCALSRVVDNKHHWTDVLVGTLCGAAVAMAMVRTTNIIIDYTGTVTAYYFHAQCLNHATTYFPTFV